MKYSFFSQIIHVKSRSEHLDVKLRKSIFKESKKADGQGVVPQIKQDYVV